MKVLVVGSGGREAAVVKKLLESPVVDTVIAAPGNGGIAVLADCFAVKATDIDGMVALARAEGVDFVVVTPDDPLVLGMADAMEAAGIPAFGPSAAAARIEGSKIFAKKLMADAGIPTARWEAFDDPAAALCHIRAQNTYPAVIKADGLALGKGVILAADEAEAADAIRTIMEDRAFGESGSRVVVEEFLTGPEVTVLAFCDGRTVVPMVSSMDHKRAYDGDTGPNTGGMGVVAPNPHYTPEIARQCMEEIFRPTVAALNAMGCPFKGCLYFGLMLTPAGPRVIEYNCRFGDPETQVVLPLLDGDLAQIMWAVREGRLAEVPIGWKPGVAATVVLASGGYPVAYKTGYPIEGLDEKGGAPGVEVFHAGSRRTDAGFETAGGRVLAVTALGAALPEALAKAYDAVGRIHFTDCHYRTDIGRK